MQKVSEAWVANQNELITSEGFVEIEYVLVDPDIVSEVADTTLYRPKGVVGSKSILDNSGKIFQSSQNEPKITSLEVGGWLLDGSHKHFNQDEGIYGSINSFLKTSTKPRKILQISFESTLTKALPGLTIVWSKALGEYAVDFNIVLDGDTVHEVRGNKDVTSVVELEIKDVDEIEIQVLKWCLPEKNIRLTEVRLGIVKVFTKKDILSFEAINTMDSESLTLPQAQIRFELDNSNNLYNPLNPKGSAKYLIERQEVRTRYGFKLGDTIEWIDGGVYYMSEWSANQNGLSASFVARDVLHFLDKPYLKGRFSSEGVILKDLVKEVIEDANLPKDAYGKTLWCFADEENTYGLDTVVNSPTTPLSHREYLQLACNILHLPLWVNRKGEVVVGEPIFIRQMYIENSRFKFKMMALNSFNALSKSQVTLKKPISKIEVTSKIGRLSNQEELVYDSAIDLSKRKHFIPYTEPFAGVGRVELSRGQVIESKFYANGVELEVSGSGFSFIRVFDRRVEVFNTTHEEVLGVKNGETITINNPLLSPESVNYYIDTAKPILVAREEVSLDWRADPRIDVGDIVRHYDDKILFVTESKITFNGSFKGSLKGRFWEIPRALGGEG